MKRYFSTLLLGTALLVPTIAVRANDDDHRDQNRRYYDEYGRDYHVWNDREDQAYRRYLQERNEQYRDLPKLNKHEQSEYWKWRHHHPDLGDMDRETPPRTR
jgi:hypothetical protein